MNNCKCYEQKNKFITYDYLGKIVYGINKNDGKEIIGKLKCISLCVGDEVVTYTLENGYNHHICQEIRPVLINDISK